MAGGAATVVKRDGRTESFDRGKVFAAVERCLRDGLLAPEGEAAACAAQVAQAVANIVNRRGDGEMGVEDVQRLVIQQLWALGHFDAAERYTLYREGRRKLRDRSLADGGAAAVQEDAAHFDTPLQYFQFLDKYARWNEEKRRRETWRECCTRVMGWFRRQPQLAAVTPEEWAWLDAGLYGRRASCAMRIVQMAGPALDRCNSGAFNCSYVAVDCLDAFVEALYLLMQGCGVGFSVEADYVDQLPRVKRQAGRPARRVVIPDTTEGWCDSYREGLRAWFAGEDVEYDASLVRPEGARLKTKGGRASGAGPLLRLLSFARDLVLRRQGKRLTTADAHHLMCVTGKIVQVGGVRRASAISLSDLDDAELRDAKSGNWWESSPWLDMANISAVYEERPDAVTFLEEWLALARSGSGERGVFNRGGALRQIPKRRKKARFGLNPCVPADTWVLTGGGPRRVADLVGVPFTAVVNGRPYLASGFVRTGVRPLLKLTTASGLVLRLTANHRVLVVTRMSQKKRHTEWREAGRIRPGDRVVLHDHRGLSWGGAGTEAEGYLLGSLLGDGCFGQKGVAYLDFWGETREAMRESVLGMIRGSVAARSDCVGTRQVARVGKLRIQSKGVGDLAARFGLGRDKAVTDAIEETSSAFHAGFLRGWFDADGSVNGSQAKGVSVRLNSSNLDNLRRAQRMLARLGINSTLYENRREAGSREMPDGKGGSASYWCEANHDLVVANDNLAVFVAVVGFGQPDKRDRLKDAMAGYRRKLNRERFAEVVSGVADGGVEPVYDCAVPGPEAFDANGVYVHNCGEILLRPSQFCNLSIAVARADDTPATLEDKVRLAAFFGTIQSTLTRFAYVRDVWRQNTEEERLLGVDVTGQMDCPLLRPGAPGRGELVRHLLGVAVGVNADLAARLGIPASAAVTCVKPSGNSAAFFGCSSGLHPRFGTYQVRRVRISRLNPLARLLADEGVPHAPDPLNDSLLVFDFLPAPAPEGTPTRHDMSAVEQFRNWLFWKENWTEHNPSATIYVGPDEWVALGAEVYGHFDKVGGLSFLPRDNGTYRLAPNEELTREDYEARLAAFPRVNWAKLSRYEESDQTTASQEPACAGGACEL